MKRKSEGEKTLTINPRVFLAIKSLTQPLQKKNAKVW